MFVNLKETFLVEEKIKKMDYPTPKQLWKAVSSKLKRKQKLGAVLEYFLDENMIALDKGHIVWIHQPHLDAVLQRRGFLVL